MKKEGYQEQQPPSTKGKQNRQDCISNPRSGKPSTIEYKPLIWPELNQLSLDYIFTVAQKILQQDQNTEIDSLNQLSMENGVQLALEQPEKNKKTKKIQKNKKNQ